MTPQKELKKILSEMRPRPDRIFLLSDKNVAPLCESYIHVCETIAPTCTLTVEPGERSKSLETSKRLAIILSEKGATRNSVMINVGGGVVTDLGGFTASIFKRGIRTVNVATSLLGAVDAAIGGKTGVDLGYLKNEIGSFWMPEGVITATDLLLFLPADIMADGYAELLKTAMLADERLYRKALDFEGMTANVEALGKATERCAQIKKEIVALDPKEQGLRRILNLGHTFGHAFESLLIKRGRPVGHGTSVAHGLLCSLIMSHLVLGLDSKEIETYRTMLLANYRRLGLGCPDNDEIKNLIGHDKKCGGDGRPRFVLLKEIGSPVEAHPATDEEIDATLEIYNTMT